MNGITPNLWFDKNAEEAVNFYTTLFPNSKIGSISRFGKEGFEHHGMPEGTVMTIEFELDGKKFLGLNGGPIFKFTPAVSFYVYCESVEQIEYFYSKLSDGGITPFVLGKYDWSEKYAWVTDKYGISWQLDISNPNTDQKILPTLMFTNEKFLKVKEAITHYTSIFPNSKVNFETYLPKSKNVSEDSLLFAQFTLNGNSFNAMSGPGKHEFDFNESISFILNCDTQDEVDYYWDKFTEQGNESMCGWLKDKYGVSWQVVPVEIFKYIGGKDKEKRSRALNAMFQMKKLELEKLKETYNGEI